MSSKVGWLPALCCWEAAIQPTITDRGKETIRWCIVWQVGPILDLVVVNSSLYIFFTYNLIVCETNIANTLYNTNINMRS